MSSNNNMNASQNLGDPNLLLNATGLLGGATNTTSYDSNRHLLCKHELYQAKRQLADALNSYEFIKNQKKRLEHEKNVMEIQMRDMHEAHVNRVESDQQKEA
jgi:hypothetical protein